MGVDITQPLSCKTHFIHSLDQNPEKYTPGDSGVLGKHQPQQLGGDHHSSSPHNPCTPKATSLHVQNLFTHPVGMGSGLSVFLLVSALPSPPATPVA